MRSEYDYLIVGAGLFGATFACLAKRQGRRCLVIDKRSHVGGNLYCEEIEGINVHKYGAHIFHTSDREVWNFVNSIVPFNRYTNSPVAQAPDGRLYNLPFNMNTFYQMWGVTTPAEAQRRLDEQRREAVAKMKAEGVVAPRNLEEQAAYQRLYRETMGAILHRVACIYNPSSAGAHDLRQQLFQRLIPRHTHRRLQPADWGTS